MKIIQDNVECLLDDTEKYVDDSYKEFSNFGGPSVYFHHKCLEECRENFLSERHIELVYATLTAWGMHRMGNSSAKLVKWEDFHKNILKYEDKWKSLNVDKYKMTTMDECKYTETIQNLMQDYDSLKLSESNQSVVVNSKALFHLLPELIPPIDRQYTVRFFSRKKEDWLKNGKFKTINLPSNKQSQFDLFKNLCVEIKKLSMDLTHYLENKQHNDDSVPKVSVPKAIDNAIVNYVRINKRIEMNKLELETIQN